MARRQTTKTISRADGRRSLLTPARWLAALAAMTMAFSLAPLPAFAQGSASDANSAIQITKTAGNTPDGDVATYAPGDTVSYTIVLGCQSPGLGNCVGAGLSDAIPAPLTLSQVLVNDPDNSYIDNSTGDTVAVDFTYTNDQGAGMRGGNVVQINVSAVIPSTITWQQAQDLGQIVNTASFTTDTLDATDDAVIVIDVPEALAADATKSTDATSTIPAEPGRAVGFTIGGGNTSNRPVDSITITDPAAGSSNTEYLDLTGIGPITYPAGADQFTVTYTDATGTSTLGPYTAPTSTVPITDFPDPTTVTSLSFTFSNSVPGTQLPPATGPADYASIGVDTVTNDLVDNLPPNQPLTVHNVVDATVDVEGRTASDTAEADVVIDNVPPSVAVDKGYDVNTLLPGQSTTANLRVDNGGKDVTSMTIVDPGAGGDDFAAQGLIFEGFDDAGVAWPRDATGVSITYDYADGSDETLTGTAPGDLDTIPASSHPEDVVGFTITFTGPILANAYATLPYEVTAQPVTGDDPVTTTNTVDTTVTDADGESSDATDSADVTRTPARVYPDVEKDIVKDSVYNVPGSSTLVQLTGTVRPDSTTGADYLVVQDPAVIAPGPSAFWNYFDLSSIGPVTVPTTATMTVSYLECDTGPWTPFDGMPVAAGATWSYTIPDADKDDICGVQFRYEPLPGEELDPGFTTLNYFTVELRDDLRDGNGSTADIDTTTTIPNDAAAVVDNPDTGQGPQTDTDGDSIDIVPIDGGPGDDLIDKSWTPSPVTALSGATTAATLAWWTAGVPMDTMTITDMADADTIDVADSAFDAFDLASIDAITPSTDPGIRYDQVYAERFSDASNDWEPIGTCTDTTPCAGQFPQYTLTAAERDDTLGIRFVFSERPDRAAIIAATPPPLGSGIAVGSGVAETSSADRDITLRLQLRNYLRSVPTQPALGTAHTYGYNTGTPGLVHNEAAALGERGGVPYDEGRAGADITIVDEPMDTTLEKRFVNYDPSADDPWNDSADIDFLPLPPAVTPAADYPGVTALLRATNTAVRVGTMTIADPDPGIAANMLDQFNLYGIVSITVPSGANPALSRVYLSPAVGGQTEFTIAEAQALTSTQLADVTSIRVEHSGAVGPDGTYDTLISAGATSDIRLELQMRKFLRSAPTTPVTETGGTPIVNHAIVTETRPGIPGTETATDIAQDELQIVAGTYGVETTKSIDPATRSEVDSPDDYVVTITGQPTGTIPSTSLTLTDARATFWNAFDFGGFRDVVLPSPIQEIRADALVGIDYSLEAGALVARCAGDLDLSACWVDGAWITAAAPGGTVTAAELAASLSVADADVRGLRFTYRTVGGTHWERPTNPLISTQFSADRREFLVYDGTPDGVDTEVPSDRPGLPPAPGESAAGVFTDTVTAFAQGSWSFIEGVPYTAIDIDTATTRLTHVDNAVSVSKVHGREAAGANQDTFFPGEEIPYQITVENTGQWPIAGLTVTDQVQTDADGPMLVEPARAVDDTTPIYTATAAGTDVDPFSGAMNLTTGLITFTLPAGFVLQPGQTLEITASLIFRQTPTPVSPGTDVLNTVDVTSDRYFDTCDYTTQAQPQTPIDDTATCSSSTTDHPAAVGPISTVKSVKGVGAGVEGAASGDANYDDLGVVGVNLDAAAAASYCASANAGQEYYVTPCVPITRPGGVEQWRLQMTNAGNIPVQTIAAIDVLPGVGDTGVTVSGPRGSRWQPTFLGSLATSAALPGATFGVWYSTIVPNEACNQAEIQYETGGISSQFASCTDEVQNQRPTMWQPYSNALPADVLATVRALKVTVTFSDTDPLQPNSTVEATFQTRTPWYSDQTETAGNGVDPIAWNSVAAGSVGDSLGTPVQSPVVEPRKAGVALATGQIQFEKTITGLDPAWGVTPPDDYAFTVACTSGGEPVPLVGPDGADLSRVRVAADGTPLVYNGGTGQWGQVTLPLYAQCTLTEDAADPNSQGASVSFDPAGTVDGTSGEVEALRFDFATNVVDPADTAGPGDATISATNTYLPGGFVVTKAVDDGGAVDENGDAITYDRTYDFRVSCTFLGQGIALASSDAEFTLTDGTTHEVDGLPAGADCDVEETNAGGAPGTTIVVTQDGVPGDEADATEAGFTVLPYADGSMTALTTVTVTNHYTVGAVLVTKTLVDPGDWGTASFELEMTCTLDGVTPDPVYEGSATVTAASPTWQVDDLPTGASCTVTETEDGGANSSSGPVTVTVGDDPAVPTPAGITNTFTVGALQVVKELDGDPAAQLDAAMSYAYEVSLSCEREVNGAVVDVAIPGGATRTVTVDTPALYEGLPTGAECSVSETDAGFSTGTPQISPAQPVEIGVGADPVVVTVTNVFENGSLSIEKAVVAPAGFPVPDDFTVTVTCTWQGDDVPLPGDGVYTITGDGTPTVVSPVPVGSECAVVEDDFGQIGTTVTPASITVDDAVTPVEVTVTNTYEWASLEVRKVVVTASEVIPTQFEFHVVCTFQGDTVVDETFTLDDGETETIAGIPARSECTVTETDPRDADATITLARVPGATGALAPQIDQTTRTVVIPELPPGGNEDIATVAYVNGYGATQVVLTKEFAGGGAGQFGVNQTFTIDYVCTFDGEIIADGAVELNAENGFTSPTATVVIGAECTVTEPDLQGADAVVVTPNDGVDTATGSFVVPREGGLVTVTATNWYLTGSLEVTKTFAGAGADRYGTDDFTLRLACTREGVDVDIPGGADRIVNADAPVALWTTLPTGADCTLTEPDAGGANATVIYDENGDPVTLDPDGGYTFTVTTDATVLSEDDQTQPPLTVENTFNLAHVSVTKAIDTDAVDADGDPVAYGPFEVTLSCRWNGGPVMAFGPMTRSISDGETVTWRGLPEGAHCIVTESDDAGASSTTAVVTQGGTTADALLGRVIPLEPLPNTDADDQTSVALTNVFDVTSLTVSKVVDGTAAASVTRTFPVQVTCVLIDPSHPAPGLVVVDDTYEIGGPQRLTATIDDIPAGSECTVTETDTGGADATTMTIDGVLQQGAQGTVTLAAGTVGIVFTNTFTLPLPPTGGVMSAAVPLVALGLMLIGGLLVVFVRRRRSL